MKSKNFIHGIMTDYFKVFENVAIKPYFNSAIIPRLKFGYKSITDCGIMAEFKYGLMPNGVMTYTPFDRKQHESALTCTSLTEKIGCVSPYDRQM